MMKTALSAQPLTDVHGHTAEEARALFNANHVSHPINLRHGVWYVRVLTNRNHKGHRVMPFPVYVALDQRSQLVSNGTLRDTIELARKPATQP